MKVLPSFIVVGGQRCGTTWLYQRFLEHPEIYVPENRKELEFFDKNYKKGLDWYQRYFEISHPEKYRAIGEITPSYCDKKETLNRIKETVGGVKVIMVIRDPCERVISQYQYWQKNFLEKSAITDFIKNKEVIDRSRYSEKIKNIFDVFGKENCLVLVFEELMENKEFEIKKLGDFLYVDNGLWDFDKFDEKINSSNQVKFKKLFSFFRKIGSILRDFGFDSLIEFVKRSNLMKLFGESEDASQKPSAEDKKYIRALFNEDVRMTQKLLNKPLWEKNYGE